MIKLLRLLVLAWAVAGLAACAPARLEQFSEFAKLGVAFADSQPPLLNAAFREAVATDTLQLIIARDLEADQAFRSSALKESTALLRERLALFGRLEQHSRLLRSYFVTLALLADASGDSSLGAGAKSIVDQLGAIHAGLKDATVSGIAVDTLVKAVTPIVVGTFRSIALRRELEARSKAIAEELDLQQAVLSAIAEAMRADIETRQARQDAIEIVRPYVVAGPLPADWNERRTKSFQRQIALEAVDAAARAAENLRQSFIALTETGGLASLSLLLQDVSTLVALVETLKASKT